MTARVEIFSAGRNQERTIEETIRSVLAQEMNDWTFTYIDLGSRDRSLEISRKYAGLDSRISATIDPSTVRAEVYNRILRNSTAKYVAFLDSDDAWEPAFLSVLVEYLDRFPDCSLAFSACQAVDEANSPVETRRNDPIPEARVPVDLRERMLFELNIVLCPSSVVIRGDSFRKAGGWPAGFPYPFLADDYILWMKLGGLGPFLPIPERLTRYMVRADSSSSQMNENADLTRLLIIEALLSEDLVPRKISAANKRRFIESNVGFLAEMMKNPPKPNPAVAPPSPLILLGKLVRRFPGPLTFRMLGAALRSRFVRSG